MEQSLWLLVFFRSRSLENLMKAVAGEESGPRQIQQNSVTAVRGLHVFLRASQASHREPAATPPPLDFIKKAN